MTQKKLAQVMTLVTYIWEVPTLNLGKGHQLSLQVFFSLSLPPFFFSVHTGEYRISTLKLIILSSSLNAVFLFHISA